MNKLEKKELLEEIITNADNLGYSVKTEDDFFQALKDYIEGRYVEGMQDGICIGVHLTEVEAEKERQKLFDKYIDNHSKDEDEDNNLSIDSSLSIGQPFTITVI